MTSAVTDAAPIVKGAPIERPRERSVMIITISLGNRPADTVTPAISVGISYRILLFSDISSGRFGHPPEIPTRDCPIRLPALAALGDLDRAGHIRSGSEGAPESLAQPVVLGRQYVRTAEPEDQQHLRRPAADPPYRGESLDDLVI